MRKRTIFAAVFCVLAWAGAVALGARVYVTKATLRQAVADCEARSPDGKFACAPEVGPWTAYRVVPERPEEIAVLQAAQAIPRDITGSIAILVLVALFGFAPMFIAWLWRFLLQRIADISDAFRGSRF